MLINSAPSGVSVTTFYVPPGTYFIQASGSMNRSITSTPSYMSLSSVDPVNPNSITDFAIGPTVSGGVSSVEAVQTFATTAYVRLRQTGIGSGTTIGVIPNSGFYTGAQQNVVISFMKV
jgi:hypothetical protein